MLNFKNNSFEILQYDLRKVRNNTKLVLIEVPNKPTYLGEEFMLNEDGF